MLRAINCLLQLRVKMFRKFLFWSHLVVGVSVGVVVFIMAATGVLLTYEAQIEEWDASRHNVVIQEDKATISTDEVLAIGREKHPEENHFYIQWLNEKGRAIPLWAGPNSYVIHPYTGEVLQEGQSWVVETLHFITDLHRWLAFSGKQQAIGKEITAYSNLLFVFLIISGLYLWFSRRFNRSSFKALLLFKKRYKSKHAKHYNWHHVFGFWMLIPLFVIVMSATIFHFSWANDALYAINNEEAPAPRKKREYVDIVDGKLTYHALFEKAKSHAAETGYENWHSMWLEFGREAGNTRFWIDESLANDYAVSYALFLDNDTGEVVKVERNTDWSKGAQAWGVVRFLHTGEYFGVIGQTIAGLASLAACFLVYTGFTLSWRRLVTPWLRRKKQPLMASVANKAVETD